MAELPGGPVTWSDSLSWGAADNASEAGPGQEIVDSATVARLEPTLREPREGATWAHGDGAVDPVGATERLVEGARAHGAQVHLDTSVNAVRRDTAGRVVGVETAAGPLTGATVVLAAGVATAPLAAPLGVRVPVEPSPATLFRFRAPAGLVRTVIHNRDSIFGRSAPIVYLLLQTHPFGPSPRSGPPSAAPKPSSRRWQAAALTASSVRRLRQLSLGPATAKESPSGTMVSASISTSRAGWMSLLTSIIDVAGRQLNCDPVQRFPRLGSDVVPAHGAPSGPATRSA